MTRPRSLKFISKEFTKALSLLSWRIRPKSKRKLSRAKLSLCKTKTVKFQFATIRFDPSK